MKITFRALLSNGSQHYENIADTMIRKPAKQDSGLSSQHTISQRHNGASASSA